MEYTAGPGDASQCVVAYRHTLKVHGAQIKIALQRVDNWNAQAPFDYVLQVSVR